MMFAIKKKKVGGTDDRWLASRHGVENAKTVTLAATGFPQATDKIVKSGTPVEYDTTGKVVAYGGTKPLAGFILNDCDLKDGDEAAPMLWHGAIDCNHLPVAGFTPPAAAGQFVFFNAPGGNN